MHQSLTWDRDRGEALECRVEVERPAEDLAGARDEGEVLARAALALVLLGAVDDVRGLLGRREHEGALLGLEVALVDEAEGGGADRLALDGQRHHGQRRESEVRPARSG